MADQIHPNLTLRRLMAEYGFMQEGLAEAINAAAEQLNGTPGNCTARHVRRLVSGKVAWPRDHTRAPLETVFSRPASGLGFRPPEGGAVKATVRASAPAQRQEPPVHRRKFILNVAGSMLALPALPEAGRLGVSDVACIQNAGSLLHQLDDRHGGARLADIGATYIRHVEHTTRRCTYGSNVQGYLHRALGDLAASTGWFAYDAGQHDRARSWWDTALRYALLARDPLLQARIWSYMARQACDLGHGGEAVAIARAALDATRNRRGARLSALLHARVALGHAVDGRGARCGQSLRRAEQSLDLDDTCPDPWLAFVGPYELLGQAALSCDSLGQHKKAVEYRRAAVDVEPGRFQRNSFATSVHFAECLLASGEPEEAVAAGGQAIGALPEVHCPRWAARLARFRAEVATRKVAGAEAFTERYDTLTRQMERTACEPGADGHSL